MRKVTISTLNAACAKTGNDTIVPKQSKVRPPSANKRPISPAPNSRMKMHKNSDNMTINLDLRSGKVTQITNKDLEDYTSNIEGIVSISSPTYA